MLIEILFGALVLATIISIGIFLFKKGEAKEEKYAPEINLKFLGDLEDEKDFEARVRWQIGNNTAPAVNYSTNEHLPSRAINYRRNLIVIASLLSVSLIPSVYLDDMNFLGLDLKGWSSAVILGVVLAVGLYNYILYWYYRSEFKRTYGETLFDHYSKEAFDSNYQDEVDARYRELNGYKKTDEFKEKFDKKPHLESFLLREQAYKEIKADFIGLLIREQPLGRSFQVLDVWIPNIASAFIALYCFFGIVSDYTDSCTTAESCKSAQPNKPNIPRLLWGHSENYWAKPKGILSNGLTYETYGYLCSLKDSYHKILEEGHSLFGASPSDAIKEGTYLNIKEEITLNNVGRTMLRADDSVTIFKRMQNPQGYTSYLAQVKSDKTWIILSSTQIKSWYETLDIIESYNKVKSRWYQSKTKKFYYDWYEVSDLKLEDVILGTFENGLLNSCKATNEISKNKGK